MTRPIQRFTPAYLRQCAKMTVTQRAQFLEDFRHVAGAASSPRKLISLRVPQHTLSAFKAKAATLGISYQRKIQELMAEWVTAKR